MPSSAIRTFDYDPESRQLWVKFVSGKTYVYDRVPEELPDAFRAAQSKGAFFNRFIRDRYPFREVIGAD
jgi:hypothetical protein